MDAVHYSTENYRGYSSFNYNTVQYITLQYYTALYCTVLYFFYTTVQNSTVEYTVESCHQVKRGQ